MLRAAKVSRRTLAGAGFQRTARGYHRRATDGVVTVSPAQRIVDAVALLPEGGLVAGWAAAYVHGVSVLDGLDHLTLAPLPVPILLPPRQRRRDTKGLTYWQSSRRVTGQVVEDVPVTSGWRTLVDLTGRAPELTEAVVAVDAFLAARLTTPDALRRQLARTPSRRGIAQTREAIALGRMGVPSTWETRLRMFAVLEVGLTDLIANRAVFDQAGVLLGVPDLLDVEAGLALEYDGARWQSGRAYGHRDREQHREDNAREERLERAGLIVVRAEKADLTTHRPAWAGRIRTAYADGLARDRTRDRWTIDEPEGYFGLPA